MYRARKNKVEYGAALQSIVEPVNILEKKRKGKKIIECKKNSLESLIIMFFWFNKFDSVKKYYYV